MNENEIIFGNLTDEEIDEMLSDIPSNQLK